MDLLTRLWTAIGGAPETAANVETVESGQLSSVFAVSDLAAASMGVAGLATADLVAAVGGGRLPCVQVDRRLASMWFSSSLRAQGWIVPPVRDSLSADYRAKDRWIRLHTNASPHRAAALSVLRATPERNAVSKAVSTWQADALEEAVVAANGCAATMRSRAEWAAHPQGQAVAAEPLCHIKMAGLGAKANWTGRSDRPLQGIRVLDLTRVIAGPIATRFLAGLGADVLRLDPPWWDEAGTVPDMTLGKRCARLDLRTQDGHAQFSRLLAEADVFVHGLRPEALTRPGFDAETRQRIRPGLVDISLDSYGWSGPWFKRRGFDSLVQMSCGIAEAGMQLMQREHPVPLPVQALDHATGYLMAAAAVRGLTESLRSGRGCEVQTSLARMAAVLIDYPADPAAEALAPEQPSDFSDMIEMTPWGAARRLKMAVAIEGVTLQWQRSASPLGTAKAVFE